MAGHSKWANIKHRKQSVDEQRSKRFQKIAQEITAAAQNNPDFRTNAVLRGIIARAKALNMPKTVIDRAILPNKNIKPQQIIFFEGRYAKIITLLISVNTSNRIRIFNSIKKIANKTRLEIFSTSSFRHLFSRYFYLELANISEKKLWSLIDDLPVNDFVIEEDNIKVELTTPEGAKILSNRCQEAQISIISSQEKFIPHKTFSLSRDQNIDYNFLRKEILEFPDIIDIFDNLTT